MPDYDATTADVLHGLRLAGAAVTAFLLGTLSVIQLLGHLSFYHPLWAQFVIIGVLALICAAAVALAATDRSWGSWAAPTAALVLILIMASHLTLKPVDLTQQADWAFGMAGWFGVVLFFDKPLIWLVGFIAAHFALVGAELAIAAGTDRPVLLSAAIAALLVTTFQIGVGGAAGALRRVAAGAIAAAREREIVQTDESVATQVHADRRKRYDELARTARPLLLGLATEALDPSDRGVQRACAIEAARMRRLFAETDDSDHPLLHELRAAIDVAERRGTAVALVVKGTCPPLPRDLRHALTDWPAAALATAGAQARVTVIATAEVVSVNVVTDDLPPRPAAPVPGVSVRTVQDDAMQWLEVKWIRH